MKILVTGGAGFIGSNAVKRYVDAGHDVVVIDNLSRWGSEKNLQWLRRQGRFTFHACDIRDRRQVERVFQEHKGLDVILHLAAQVAVTTSVSNPRDDFEVNALGTFNVLEAVRQFAREAIVIYASTNKVYGGIEHIKVIELDGRYQFRDQPSGISEREPLDFHSPYGCSKGAADQYVRDYARIYGIRTVCFRQSCIYGYRQFGVEDQGWVAWFTIAAALGRPITIFGDGKQVRDVLFIDDLCDLYVAAVEQIDRCGGQVYNIGGGIQNQLSLVELISMLRTVTGNGIRVSFADWRAGDQRVFVCDISKATRHLGWRPRVPVANGVQKLHEWVCDNAEVLQAR